MAFPFIRMASCRIDRAVSWLVGSWVGEKRLRDAFPFRGRSTHDLTLQPTHSPSVHDPTLQPTNSPPFSYQPLEPRHPPERRPRGIDAQPSGREVVRHPEQRLQHVQRAIGLAGEQICPRELMLEICAG